MQANLNKTGTPVAKKERVFLEIVDNFTDSRDVIREAISNALDWNASNIEVTVYEDATRPDSELVIEITDDGCGLNRERFEAFWNLADCPGLQRDRFGRKLGSRVGEKGHGTKTYWNSREIEVESVSRDLNGNDWHVLGVMTEPKAKLLKGEEIHYQYAEDSGHGKETFTRVTIRGYNPSRREDFRHESLKDYILWFTKFGSIELELGIRIHEAKKLKLQGLGRSQPETITFGHVLPPENANIPSLKRQYGDDWPRYFVKKWVYPSEAVEGYPSSTIDVVFYFEGDTVKRSYNEMLTRPGRTREVWHYTVQERYGLFVCKDHIPLPASQRVNEWIAEKSEWTYYHAFVNCQDFALTANRASIGNTDGSFLVKVREAVNRVFTTHIKNSKEYMAYEDEVADMKTRGIIEASEKSEIEDFDRRYYHAKKKRLARYQPPARPRATLSEPRQEAEVLILFSTVAALKPDLFEFEIVDYSTSRGLDALCRLKPAQGGLVKGDLRYVEFKTSLTREFRNHSFRRLAAIVCWDCSLPDGETVRDMTGEERTLRITPGIHDHTAYMLMAPPTMPTNNIEVYVLKEYLREKLGITFRSRSSDSA